MSVKSTFVMVGAGLAGAKTAETPRSQGFDGRIVLTGDEAARPYERPSVPYRPRDAGRRSQSSGFRDDEQER